MKRMTKENAYAFLMDMKRMTKEEAFEYLENKKMWLLSGQSPAVQKKLFEIGFEWAFEGTKVCHTDERYLFTNENGFITYSDEENFMYSDLECISSTDILRIEIVEEKEEKKEPEFSIGEWVLVRDYDKNIWDVAQFAYKAQKGKYPYVIFGGDCFEQCIPYEGNEHLMGTTEIP